MFMFKEILTQLLGKLGGLHLSQVNVTSLLAVSSVNALEYNPPASNCIVVLLNPLSPEVWFVVFIPHSSIKAADCFSSTVAYFTSHGDGFDITAMFFFLSPVWPDICFSNCGSWARKGIGVLCVAVGHARSTRRIYWANDTESKPAHHPGPSSVRDSLTLSSLHTYDSTYSLFSSSEFS